MWVYYRVRYASLTSFFTIALLLAGTAFLGYYVTAPETQITSRVNGFAIATNETLTLLREFDLTLDVKSGFLYLHAYWQYVNTTRDIGRPFNIVVVLPFILRSYVNSSLYPPSIRNWNLINTNITNVAASALSASFTGKYTNASQGDLYGNFFVANTYANSRRGSYRIVLPLDAGIDGPDFPSLSSLMWNESVICCTLADETNVVVTFPKTAVNIQTFPQANFGVNSADTLDLVRWTFTQRAQASLYFVDQDEQSTFEISVIIGSLLLGAGISGIAEWLKPHSA
jgi:hypothetical protein